METIKALENIEALEPIHYPKIKTRFAAMIYEACLLFGIIFFAGYFFITLTQSKSPENVKIWLQLWVGFVLGVYFSYSWHHGWTLPMKTWRMRIMHVNTLQSISYLQAWSRYIIIMSIHGLALFTGVKLHWSLGIIILLINWGIGIFDSKKRPLHDLIAKTVLVLK